MGWSLRGGGAGIGGWRLEWGESNISLIGRFGRKRLPSWRNCDLQCSMCFEIEGRCPFFLDDKKFVPRWARDKGLLSNTVCSILNPVYSDWLNSRDVPFKELAQPRCLSI